MQQGIFESRFESERGTVSRLFEGVRHNDEKMFKLIYDPDNGLIVQLDRLKQQDKKNEERKKQVWGLWVIVIGMVIKIIFDEVTKK